MSDRRCPACGGELRAFARADARYCSGACRVRGHRARVRWARWRAPATGVDTPKPTAAEIAVTDVYSHD